jgi:hypothetical protein
VHKTKIAALVAVAFTLMGCTADEISAGIERQCKWVPTAKLVRQVVTGITGLPPGVGIGLDVAQTAVDAVCTAVSKKATAGPRALVLVEVRNRQTGQIVRSPLQGRPATR